MWCGLALGFSGLCVDWSIVWCDCCLVVGCLIVDFGIWLRGAFWWFGVGFGVVWYCLSGVGRGVPWCCWFDDLVVCGVWCFVLWVLAWLVVTVVFPVWVAFAYILPFEMTFG